MTVKNKRLVSTFAALQILLYHCWIPVFRYNTAAGITERFLLASTFTGVDMFFFLSGYSLVLRPPDDYCRFIRNRSIKLLPLFFVALFLGCFLWFIPAIMLVYLILPPLYNICRKKPLLSLIILMSGWCLAVYLILGINRPDQDLGIFLFRIPSVILGAYSVNHLCFSHKRSIIIAAVILLVFGLFLIYRFGFTDRLNTPFRGTFYLTGIPLMLGTFFLLQLFPEEHIPPVIVRFGGMTLELYFTQMVFGSYLVGFFYSFTGNKLVTNIVVIVSITVISAVIGNINILINKKHFV